MIEGGWWPSQTARRRHWLALALGQELPPTPKGYPCKIRELEVARTFERIRKKIREIIEYWLFTFRANKKKDGDTIRLRKALCAVNLFIRKLFFNELISPSSRLDPSGTYSDVFSANSAWGLNSILTLHAGLELELNRA